MITAMSWKVKDRRMMKMERDSKERKMGRVGGEREEMGG